MNDSRLDDSGDSIEQPHNKMSTPLGRLIDKVAYWQVALAAATTIFLSSAYFWLTSGSGNGLDKCGGKALGEALYFSIITFSTLGYGDLTPIAPPLPKVRRRSVRLSRIRPVRPSILASP